MNESALFVYRCSWKDAGGVRMEVQWSEGSERPLMIRNGMVREIARPERFGWKVPGKFAAFKKFAQIVADEWEALASEEGEGR